MSGEKKTVVKVVLRLRDSRAFRIGPSDGTLADVKLPYQEKWGGAPPLYSGNITVNFPGMHREEANFVIEHDDPVPLTIISANSYISIG